MLHKYFTLPLIACLLPFITASPAAAAPLYADVPESHPAYASIARIAQKGILVSDASGNYRPDDFIDKFETAKILAGLAGYKQIGASDAEREYYDRAYDKNRGLVSQYGKTFAKWKTSTDREIAFLIEKEILTPEDLNQFVVTRDGAEVLRALSKEEAAVYIVRLTDNKTPALSAAGVYSFALPADDAKTAAAYKPYVYFMLEKGLMATDDDNNFNPKQAVTRAGMAVLLDGVLSQTEGLDPDSRAGWRLDDGGAEAAPLKSVIESVSGEFDRLFGTESDGALQLTGADGVRQLYRLSPSVTVYFDGFLKTVSDLKQGTWISAVLDNLFITEIRAGANRRPAGAAEDPSGPVSLYAAEGKLVSITTDLTVKTIGLEVKLINTDGRIITDTKFYAVQEGARVTREGADCGLSDLKIGDICVAEVSGAKVYSISLEPSVRDVTGRLIGRKNNSVQIYGDNGAVYEFYADADTTVTRDGVKTNVNRLRSGDAVTARAEYDRLLTVTAEGKFQTVAGSVEAVRSDRSGSYVSVSSGSVVAEYPVSTDSADMALLRVGAEVVLFLDSSEVYAVYAEADGRAKNHITGTVTEKRGNSVTVSDNDGRSVSMYADPETSVYDSASGERTVISRVYEGDRVYAHFAGDAALNITVLP